jgi:hypothetical protein
MFSVLKPDWLFLFQSMKRKQKSCQNEPSAGRFDGLPTRFDGVKTKPKESHLNLMFGLKANAMRCLCTA